MTNQQKYFVHELGLCETKDVKEGTRIWAYAHILPGARIGRDCNICDHVFIEDDVIVGDRVTIKSGVQLWNGVRLQDDVFVGPNATFTNDPFPRSKQYPEKFEETIIEKGASVGANATILPGLRIGQKAMIGAGTVVTADVPPFAIVVGNPGQITGYASFHSSRSERVIDSNSFLNESEGEPHLQKPVPLGVGKCELWPLPNFADLRGQLTAVEFVKDLPFPPKRQFFVYGVTGSKVRGEHAHKECAQFLIAIHGSLSVLIDDGDQSCEVKLEGSNKGLYIPPLIWNVQYKFLPGTVLAVYASHNYENEDYIRSHDEFLDYIKKPSS